MAHPGFYFDFGKKAKDILYKDFQYDKKFTLNTTAAGSLGFIVTAITKGDATVLDIKSDLKHSAAKFEVFVDQNGVLRAGVVSDTLMKGLKVGVSGALPDNKSGKLDLAYKYAHMGYTLGVGLNSTPKVDVSAVVGSGQVAFGLAAAYDTNKNEVTKYEAGLTLNQRDFSATAIIGDKGDNLRLSYVHVIDPDRAVAAEVSKAFSKGTTNIAAGAYYRADDLTAYKIRVDSTGVVHGLLAHQLRPDTTLILTAQADSKNLDKNTKYGFALSHAPKVYR